tara:strand:+ start:1732 stop:1977 length:246 start_codon:yes stop_codon:yes gene_type:complete
MSRRKNRTTVNNLITKIRWNDRLTELLDAALLTLEELHDELPEETKPLIDMKTWIQETLDEKSNESSRNFKTIQSIQKLNK